MKTGLFFGSFNPVHIGHLAIANYMLEFTDLEELWMIVSPHNPLKNIQNLVNENDRLKMVELAIGDNNKMVASDIEFQLPKPSFTVDTLAFLKKKYPKKEFVLIIGSDNFGTFHKWKNYEDILKNYQIYVYPRPGSGLGKYANYSNIRLITAPLIEISSSFIRKSINTGKNIRYFLNEAVYQYIKHNNFYKS